MPFKWRNWRLAIVSQCPLQGERELDLFAAVRVRAIQSGLIPNFVMIQPIDLLEAERQG